MISCSSSCCGVGYDALQSQLCPVVAAVALAARVGGGAAVLCEYDMKTLGQKLGSRPVATAAAACVATAPCRGADIGGCGVAVADAAASIAAGSLEVSGCVARFLSAASGALWVLGPNHVVSDMADREGEGRTQEGQCRGVMVVRR